MGPLQSDLDPPSCDGCHNCDGRRTTGEHQRTLMLVEAANLIRDLLLHERRASEREKMKRLLTLITRASEATTITNV